MIKNFLFSVILVFSIAAQDITVSKDSLRVNGTVNTLDTVTITNSGADQVFIDSLLVHFDSLDTTQLFFSLDDMFEAILVELYNGTPMTHFDQMKSLGNNLFSVNFLAESRPPFPIPPGGTTKLANVRFGNFTHSAVSRCPNYLEGTLYFYFNNGYVDSLMIYADNLQTTITKRSPPVRKRTSISGNRAQYLINGRKIIPNAAGVNRVHIRHRLYELKIKE